MTPLRLRNRAHQVIRNLEELAAHEESVTPTQHSPNRVQVIYEEAIALIRELSNRA